MDNLSIVIRNRNESEFIGFSIQSCLDQFDKPEIIIVDNYSTDDSLEVVNLFKDRTSIKILKIKDYTPGKSLNQGVNAASHDYILILSAHCQIIKMDLNLLKRKIEHYKGIFGKQNPIYRGKKITKRYIWSHFKDEEIENMHSAIENRPFFHNAFSFFKRTDYLENPMPEEVPGKEDRFWAREIINQNSAYLYTPMIEVNHFYTTKGATWKGLG
jgi:rhamnosyltransferase